MSPVAAFLQVRRDYFSGWWCSSRLRALDDVSFQIHAGEVFGLLGPNRAGKTTLIKLLLSLCRPTSGSIQRMGKPAEDRSTLRTVGYMHENHAFPRYLSARELLHFYGSMTLLSHDILAERVDHLLTLVGIADRGDEPINRFSKGMIQRLGMAQALLNEPHLLVLDEPTEGLDLSGRRILRDIIHQTRTAGKTVLLVSHVVSEVESLCDRIAVLRAVD